VFAGVATIAGYVVRDWRSVLDSGRSILLQVQTESGARTVTSAPSVIGRNVKCT